MRREAILTAAVALTVASIFMLAWSMDSSAKSDVKRQATIDTFELHMKIEATTLPALVIDGVI